MKNEKECAAHVMMHSQLLKNILNASKALTALRKTGNSSLVPLLENVIREIFTEALDILRATRFAADASKTSKKKQETEDDYNSALETEEDEDHDEDSTEEDSENSTSVESDSLSAGAFMSRAMRENKVTTFIPLIILLVAFIVNNVF